MTVRWSSYAQSLTDAADEGHADRAGDDAAVVLRARRPAARDGLPADRARHPRRGARPGGGRHRASSRSTSRPCARACRCAAPSGRATCAGRSPASGSPPPASRDETQIHTHMCYAEFNDIIERIAAMDADVISIETSRSRHGAAGRPSPPSTTRTRSGRASGTSTRPRIPSAEEMAGLLRRAAARVPPERLWVNPDCGCKTRGWAEVRPAIENLVAAARLLRAEPV